MLLLQVIHGSKLYGLDHAHSDHDLWEVHTNTPRKKSTNIRQTIKGDLDLTKMDLSTFMMYADRSSHQVLECMFAESPAVDMLSELRQGFVINASTFIPLYQRTIKAFGLRDDLKSKRHALRMTYNLQEGLERGRFNPRLTSTQIEQVLTATPDELDSLRYNLLSEVGTE